MKEMFFNIVESLLLTLAIIVLIIVCVSLFTQKNDEKNYNDGICTECGGNYIFSSAVHVHYCDDNYYYTCDKCGHTIQTNKLMK